MAKTQLWFLIPIPSLAEVYSPFMHLSQRASEAPLSSSASRTSILSLSVVIGTLGVWDQPQECILSLLGGCLSSLPISPVTILYTQDGGLAPV